MIFIQIAAYRDPELLPTIVDCLAKAKYKNDLTFGICWQRHEADRSLDPLRDLSNFRIDDISWQKSEGLCWARSRIQRLYNNEEFTLQLDSHHRFIEHWDEKLLKTLEQTGSEKPILTSYAGIYEPRTGEKKGIEPFKMVADRFTNSGTILFRPHVICGWEDLKEPVRARFVSGHFFFTLGKHCTEYAYDPKLYFAGDEISLSIRSFTLGYDLFHPIETVIWHEYTREGRVKHWDDHVGENREQVGTLWHERDVVSKCRLRKLLREEDNEENIDGYGLGSIRSHHEYELYAGIDFGRRRLHVEARRGDEPPCTFLSTEQWEESLASTRNILLKWECDDLENCDDLNFIYFGVEDEEGTVLYRYDAKPDSAEGKLLTEERNIEFDTTSTPARLVVWPVSHSRGWLRKVVYNL
jgi:hypothetical protein